MAEKETIITKMYDLVKYLIPIVNRFPRDYKFTLGDRMTNLVLDLLEHYIQAYYSGNFKAKYEILLKNNLQLERMRFLILPANDVQFINTPEAHRRTALRTGVQSLYGLPVFLVEILL